MPGARFRASLQAYRPTEWKPRARNPLDDAGSLGTTPRERSTQGRAFRHQEELLHRRGRQCQHRGTKLLQGAPARLLAPQVDAVVEIQLLLATSSLCASNQPRLLSIPRAQELP